MKDRIRAIRKSLCLTQQEFAEQLGLKRNTIATYEMGRNEPIEAVMHSICKTFGVNDRWLRTGEGEMFVPMSRDEEIAAFIGDTISSGSDFKKRFISMLSRLSEDDWEVLERMAEEMKKD